MKPLKVLTKYMQKERKDSSEKIMVENCGFLSKPCKNSTNFNEKSVKILWATPKQHAK